MSNQSGIAFTHCAFTAALMFPEPVEAALRVAHLGTSSVKYEIGLFGDGGATPAATGFASDACP